MKVRKLDEVEVLEGNEGTKIRQIFHPHNTLNGIRYSLSHSLVMPGKKSKIHKMIAKDGIFFLPGKLGAVSNSHSQSDVKAMIEASDLFLSNL